MTDLRAVQQLVERFQADHKKFVASNSRYTETEVRTEFIDPLFGMLGWDMNNSLGVSNSMKDVVREESQASESSTKRPDYTFRIAAQRRFFVEAKKPSVDIQTNRESAVQVRSYGWTAGLPISILTNFKSIRVYDTTFAPHSGDGVDVALLFEINYLDIPQRFNELHEIFSREAVADGSIEKKFNSLVDRSIPLNRLFLNKFNEWRLAISKDLHNRYPGIRVSELNDISQKIINRFLFVRMCEDRGIEGHQTLGSAVRTKNFVDVRNLFIRLDKRYNTGLFNSAADLLQTNYMIGSDVLSSIVDELYFPQAPYSFSVLDADFLGQVYELFLEKRVEIDADEGVVLRSKPAYQGREIATTPQPLVDEVVRRTIRGRLRERPETFAELKALRLLDVAVGSGRFLLRSFDELVDNAIQIIMSTGGVGDVYQRAIGDYRLSFPLKCEILKSCLYGIDVDYNAVEVARFRLLIKLLEDESSHTLPGGSKILPDIDGNILWGNSVVGVDFVAENDAIKSSVMPTDPVAHGFPHQWDVIVGNPPYVKTEDMNKISPHELKYFKKKYRSAYKQFDKYFVFIEKYLAMAKSDCWLGFVVPNKWITLESGKNLRSILSDSGSISDIVDFGNELLFDGKSTYVCILILSSKNGDEFSYRRVESYPDWIASPSDRGRTLPKSLLSRPLGSPWILPADDAEATVLEVLSERSVPMSEVADVLNGIQTSADSVFAIKDGVVEGDRVRFEKNSRSWEIELAITKPYLMDSTKGVRSYQEVRGDAAIIFPYWYNEKGEAVLYTIEEIKEKFGLTWRYFCHFEERLRERSVSPEPKGGEFYAYGRHQALGSAFLPNKIIYSVNQLGDKYGIDNIGVGFASGGTAGEVSISNPASGYTVEFLLALLHQPVIEFYLRKRGSAFRGGYYSRGTAVMNDCPVPNLSMGGVSHQAIVDSVTQQVRQIIESTRNAATSGGSERERHLNDISNAKYTISQAFGQFWEFGGCDGAIRLPGTHVVEMP